MQIGFSAVGVSTAARLRFGCLTNEQAAEAFLKDWLDNFDKTQLENAQPYHKGKSIVVRFNNETYRLNDDDRDPHSIRPEYVELVRASSGEAVLNYVGPGCLSLPLVRYSGGKPIHDRQLVEKAQELIAKVRNLAPPKS